ncbi:MAG TPA: extracellular solute-binding protein [Actinomycetes bacterium]|jgi:ABC-type glycerol-3-phosphate transport system substrate-binding protein|nr:extracellular solute-binding protein [Actinomycetes bacterium]
MSSHANRRLLTVLAVLTCLALGVSACGGGGKGGQAPPPGQASGQLRVVSNWTGSEGEAFQAVIDAFQRKNPKVTVKVEQVPFEQTQALLTQQFAAGSPPDVAVALPGIIRNFAGQDLLLNLDDQWDAWIKDGSYTDALRQIASGPDGKAYAVLFKGNVNALVWYSPQQLRKLGIGVPTTWAGFTAAMDKAKAAGVAPVAVGGKDGWPLTQWTDAIILRVAGAQAFNDLARGKIRWDDPRIVKSFQVLGDLIGKYFPPQALATGFIDETCARAQGKFLFQNEGAFINLIVPAECNKSLKAGRDFTFFLMPKFDPSMPDAQFVSGDLFIGAKDTKNKPATLALLQFLGSAEAQEVWAKRGGYIAPNAKVPASVYPNENDRKAAALWPKSASVAAGYDLDDWIGGEIQVKYRQALAQFTRDRDVSKFIATMTRVDTRAKG